MATVFEADKVKRIRALHDHVIVCDMNFDEKISNGGIIIPSGDKKLEGIHPRWGRVYAIGPKQKDIPKNEGPKKHQINQPPKWML